jgi:hypothetical protein
MKIVVTGGAGFIGSCFVRRVLGNPSLEMVDTDKLIYAGNLENLTPVADHAHYQFVQVDICYPRCPAGIAAFFPCRCLKRICGVRSICSRLYARVSYVALYLCFDRRGVWQFGGAD